MKEYIIKQGDHYSTHGFKPYLGKKFFDITVQFTESCRYNLGDIDQLDINKLWGVSFGSHEKNSIRIGWAYNLFTDKIDLFTYQYNKGIRFYEKIGECFINEISDIQLDMGIGTYQFSGDNILSNIFIYDYPILRIGYHLYPYFGGNEVAPHDIHINLEVK